MDRHASNLRGTPRPGGLTPAAARYAAVRAASVAIAEPLSAEDCCAQSMPDASPIKWHLAHTTWFFETFVLEPFVPGWRSPDPTWRMLFNSYYDAVGDRPPRPERGLLTRPSLAEVLAWRLLVDARIRGLVASDPGPRVLDRIELGLQHEQQHQELMWTDLKHLLSRHPVPTAWRDGADGQARAAPHEAPDAAADARAVAGSDGRGHGTAERPGAGRGDCHGDRGGDHEVARDRDGDGDGERDGERDGDGWVVVDAGVRAIGDAGEGFAFDNERPRHRVFVEPFSIARRLVTNAQACAFVDAGGYRDPRLWLAEGWDWVRRERIDAPLHWRRAGTGADLQATGCGAWRAFTLAGEAPLCPQAPLRHVSYYEADAIARWLGARLPTEAEWEVAHGALAQRDDQCWQWTASSYAPYPGFRAAEGALGEYNGKFMVNQYVLRGGSCATPAGHARPTYRNFFPAAARWQFSGLRLARHGGTFRCSDS